MAVTRYFAWQVQTNGHYSEANAVLNFWAKWLLAAHKM